jgi:hypothetical protein
MTLQVSFEDFVETAKRLLQVEEAYVAVRDAGTLVTSANPDKSMILAALTPLHLEEATSALKEKKVKVFNGTWLNPEEVLAPYLAADQTFIAAVAYRSSGDKAGVWVDAYPSLPTQVSVLKAMYEEFKSTGEMNGATFEEFVQLANPNVVIISPANIESFLRQKTDC